MTRPWVLQKALPLAIFIVAMSVGLLPVISMAAANKHVSEALNEAKEAVKHGKQGHADVLGKHAEKALKHVQMSEKGTKGNPHIPEAMKDLEDAVLEAKQGHAEKGTEAAEQAVMHLSEIK
jgi:hypothetical protein